jgi:sigma-B regulation protein RsbU (phosphoserine phosphatase)
MNATSTSTVHALRPQILERRARLQAAAFSVAAPAYLNNLLAEVDAALHRIDNGTFGYCETCHDPIEADRLEGNPMVRFCLDHLSHEEMQAHQQDLDLATQIQARLLPPRDVILRDWDVQYRYVPAGAVGGDYCELIQLDDGKSMFFAVGDVAGKGVAASLLMTHLSAIFRSLLSLNLPLVEVMSRANRLFCEGTPAAHYATLVCGRTTADGIELCDAGHCAPFLLRNEVTQRLDTTGLPLGLFCAVPYTARRFSLEPGECLLLYSDGITEAPDPAGTEYGEERLIQYSRTLFSHNTEAMADGILRDVAKFRGARQPADDVTLLIVRRRG